EACKWHVECQAHRKSSHAPKQLLPPLTRRIRGDGLSLSSLSESEPVFAGADVVNVAVHRPLEKVARVRREIPDPGVQVDDQNVVIRLAEPDEPEAFAAQDDLEIEVRGLRSPRVRIFPVRA